METSQSLADFPIDTKCRITEITAEPTISARLSQFGLIPETEVECVLRSACGASAAFLVRGAVIALRKSDLQQIRAKQIKDAEPPQPARTYTVLLIGNENVGKARFSTR